MTSNPQLHEQLKRLWLLPRVPPDEPTPTREVDDTFVQQVVDTFDATIERSMQSPRRPSASRPRKHPEIWCAYSDKHRTAWKSIFGSHVICATCYPPAREKVVAEWIDLDSIAQD